MSSALRNFHDVNSIVTDWNKFTSIKKISKWAITFVCDLSFRRGASGTSLKTSIGRARPEEKKNHAHSHNIDTQPTTLATAVVDAALTSLTRKLCILWEKGFALNCYYNMTITRGMIPFETNI